MADQNFMDLASKTASGITGTDYMMLVNNSEAYKALVNDVAEAILGKLTSKSFSGLETTAKNVIGALNELNSKSKNIDQVFIKVFHVSSTNNFKFKCNYTKWGVTSRQSILFFGNANGETINGIISINGANGDCIFEGVGNIRLSSDDSGVITVTFERNAYDNFILISKNLISKYAS